MLDLLRYIFADYRYRIMNNWPTIKTMPQWATQEIVKADGGQTVTPVLYSTKTSMTSNPIKPQDHVDLTDMFKMSKNSIGNSLQWVANKIYKATRGSTLTPLLSPVKTTTTTFKAMLAQQRNLDSKDRSSATTNTTSKATLAQQRNPTRKDGSSATTTTSKAILARQRNLDSKDRPSATTTTASKANLAQQRNPANKDESSAGCNTKTSPIAGGHGEHIQQYSLDSTNLQTYKPTNLQPTNLGIQATKPQRELVTGNQDTQEPTMRWATQNQVATPSHRQAADKYLPNKSYGATGTIPCASNSSAARKALEIIARHNAKSKEDLVPKTIPYTFSDQSDDARNAVMDDRQTMLNILSDQSDAANSAVLDERQGIQTFKYSTSNRRRNLGLLTSKLNIINLKVKLEALINQRVNISKEIQSLKSTADFNLIRLGALQPSLKPEFTGQLMSQEDPPMRLSPEVRKWHFQCGESPLVPKILILPKYREFGSLKCFLMFSLHIQILEGSTTYAMEVLQFPKWDIIQTSCRLSNNTESLCLTVKCCYHSSNDPDSRTTGGGYNLRLEPNASKRWIEPTTGSQRCHEILILVYQWRPFCLEFMFEIGHNPICHLEDNFQWAISQHQLVQICCTAGVLPGDPRVYIRTSGCYLEDISQWAVSQHQQAWLSCAVGVLLGDLEEMCIGLTDCLQDTNHQLGMSQQPQGLLTYLIDIKIVEKMQLSMDHEITETNNTSESKLILLMHCMRKVEQYPSPTVTLPILGSASEWALGSYTPLNQILKFNHKFIEPDEQCQNACHAHQPWNLCDLCVLRFTVLRFFKGPESDPGGESSISLFLPVSLNCGVNEDTVDQTFCQHGGSNPTVAFCPVWMVEKDNASDMKLQIKFEMWIKRLYQVEVEESNQRLNRTNQAGKEFMALVISKRSWIYLQEKLVPMLWSKQNKQTQMMLEVSGLKVLINLSREQKEVKDEDMREKLSSSMNDANLEWTMELNDNCVQQLEAEMNDLHTRVDELLLLINDLKLLMGHDGLSSPGNLSSCYSLTLILVCCPPPPGECVAGFYHLVILRLQAEEELPIYGGSFNWTTATKSLVI